MQRRLARFFTLVVIVALQFGSFGRTEAANPPRQNTYPIVLVHGFAGWGRDEVLGFKHWGGFYDIQEDLKSQGYPTYTAAVGPFSSNWDRAIELYTQIIGGRVDYGAVHAAKHGHARYGRTYAALYAQWGQTDPATGKIKKVHLIAHSQGGQTVRVLAQLLAEGSPAEVAGTQAADISPLFKPLHRSWLDSIVTISSPHDGTTLSTGVTQLIPAAQQIIAFAAAAAGSNNINFYDFKLDQWGLTRQQGESFASFAGRVWSSSIWQASKDICAWDLSPDGARELNGWVKAQPDVYYFSWANEKTYDSLLTPYQYPEPAINPILSPEAFFMGAFTRNEPGMVSINNSWWKNDGVVNTNSMDGPTLNSTDQIVPYNGTPRKGAWNYMGVVESYDHLEMIGLGIYHDVRPWYRTLAAQLAALPE